MNKVRIECEYTFNIPLPLLYNYFSTAAGLEGWFADKVETTENNYTFRWGKTEEKARLAEKKKNSFVRFEREEGAGAEKNFFEFRIRKNEMTGTSTLIVTDYVNSQDKEDSIGLWDMQINHLLRKLGANTL